MGFFHRTETLPTILDLLAIQMQPQKPSSSANYNQGENSLSAA
jgi:hypothetical protein